MRIGFHRVHGSHRALLVLALVALSFLLARPVCAAWEVHDELAPATPAAMHAHAADGDDARPCCSAMDDAASIATAATAKPEAKAPLAVALTFAPRVLAVKPAPPGSVAPRASPPKPLDYHARSSRILS